MEAYVKFLSRSEVTHSEVQEEKYGGDNWDFSMLGWHVFLGEINQGVKEEIPAEF